MIVFGGWGSFAAVMGFGLWSGLLFAISDNEVFLATGLTVGAFVVFLFGQWLEDSGAVEVFDDQGRPIGVAYRKHHVFWISVRSWGLIFALGGLLRLAVASLPASLMLVAALGVVFYLRGQLEVPLLRERRLPEGSSLDDEPGEFERP